MRNNKGFTLIEIIIVIVLIGVAATIVSMLMNTSQIDKGMSAKLKSDLSAIETAYITYNQNANLTPTSLSDAAFVPAYLTPPRVINGFDETYGVSGYLLAYRTGQPVGQNGTYIAVKVSVSGATDEKFLTLKNIAGDLPSTKFYYNTTVPAVTTMADPAAAATIYATYWVLRN